MGRTVPGFVEHLERMHKIHLLKGEDYATNNDPLLNYHRQSSVISWFNRPQDQVYAGRIAEKLARLAVLLNKEHEDEQLGRDKLEAQNEPLTDSFLDAATIFNIWWCDYEASYRPDSPDGNRVEGPHPRLGALQEQELRGDREEDAIGDQHAPEAPRQHRRINLRDIQQIEERHLVSYALKVLSTSKLTKGEKQSLEELARDVSRS